MDVFYVDFLKKKGFSLDCEGYTGGSYAYYGKLLELGRLDFA